MGESEAAPQNKPRRTILIKASIVLLLVVAVGISWWLLQENEEEQPQKAAVIEAPPELAKFKEQFIDGIAAADSGDGAAAVASLNSFSFGSRVVEQYRLHHLARAYQIAGNEPLARLSLARLLSREPRPVFLPAAMNELGRLYRAGGYWERAAAVYTSISRISSSPVDQALAGTALLDTSFYRGDPAAMLLAARHLLIHSPASPQAAQSAAVLRAMSGAAVASALPLTAQERVERARNLIRDGVSERAFEELRSIDLFPLPYGLRQEATLQRGIALHKLRRLEESNRVLEPQLSREFRWAVPAIEHQAKNYQLLSASINPMQSKVIVERKKVGQTRVAVPAKRKKGAKAPAKKRYVLKPRFANVKRTIQVVNLPLQYKKENYQKLSVERLKDLLQLPLTRPLRRQTLTSLLAGAQSKNQLAYERELVADLCRIDPLSDAGLQRIWERAWGAYVRGDLVTAQELLTFISQTYQNPNTKRQAQYWIARSLERGGNKERAGAIYNGLASAPYEDIYAIYAQKRGGKRAPGPTTNPLESTFVDWPVLADREMPRELRFAYELITLGRAREARVEIQQNASDANRRFSNALLGELYYQDRSFVLAFRSIRAAFPQLATVEQDQVPRHFIRMYYPLVYEEPIRKYATKQNLDPYLVMALIHQESAFNSKARSGVGATGLMQLMPATGQEIGKRLHGLFNVERLDNPEVNIELGTYYLRKLIDLLGGIEELAVAGYNGGPYRIKRWREQNRGKPLDEFLEGLPLSETRNYVKRVTMLRASYKRLYGG